MDKEKISRSSTYGRNITLEEHRVNGQKASFKALQRRREKLGDNVDTAIRRLKDIRDDITEAMMYASDHEMTVLSGIEESLTEYVKTLEEKFKDALDAYKHSDNQDRLFV